jgi:hypothetical protein
MTIDAVRSALAGRGGSNAVGLVCFIAEILRA